MDFDEDNSFSHFLTMVQAAFDQIRSFQLQISRSILLINFGLFSCRVEIVYKILEGIAKNFGTAK